MIRAFIFVLLFVCCFLTQAQNDQLTDKWIRETLEKLLDNQTNNLDYTDLELRLHEWVTDPISINEVNELELARLTFLTTDQIRHIMDHRNKYGNLLSIYELQSIEGIDLQTAELLSHFVKLEELNGNDRYTWKDMIQKGSHEVIWQSNRTIQKSKGYMEPRAFEGSPFQVSTRYRFQYKNKLYLGFGMEKDAGEIWNTLGDFQTAHVFYRGKGLIQTLALGDFQSNFGSGLNFSTALFNGKSASVFQSQNYGEGFRPYRSLNESGFMRGMGISLKKKSIHCDFWLSFSPLSASIQYDSLLKEDRLASIGSSGLHRTRNEILKKNTAVQQIAGCHLSFPIKIGKAGALVNSNNRYSISSLSENFIQQILSFKDVYLGLYAQIHFQNKSFSGEYSKQVNGADAYILNCLFPLHSKVDLMLIYRSYDPLYSNAYSNAWSALSAIGNETGFYTAFTYRPKKNSIWSVYSDWFHSVAPRYQCALPGKGTDYFVNYHILFTKTFQMEFRFRFTQNDKNIPAESATTKSTNPETRYQFRVQMNYQINEENSFQFRAEKILAHKPDLTSVNGLLHFYDLKHQPKNCKWSIHARFLGFQTEGYLARIYAFESDLPYNYVQSQFNGNGNKVYLIWDYRLSRNLHLYFKISKLQMTDPEKTGSGLDEINSKNQTECRIQLKWKI